jgi:hypothetical protein
MDETLKHRLTSGEFWTRALYMILFGIAYSVAEIVLTLVVIFQFFAALFTSRVNEPLLKLGQNLSRYIYQIIRFETFNTEEKPFPFSDWPDEAPTSDYWLRDHEPEPGDGGSPAAAESADAGAAGNVDPQSDRDGPTGRDGTLPGDASGPAGATGTEADDQAPDDDRPGRV